MSHKQITLSQINEIASLKRAGVLQKNIAVIIGVTPSAISQELKRNKDTNERYHTRHAKEKRKGRRIVANQRFRKIENNQELREYAEKGLKNHWSPEQISGRIKREYPENMNMRIGKDTLYKWIYSERKDLVHYLRCKKGSYRRRYGTRIREKERERGKIKRIDERPEIVEKRERIGDWEGDTIIGKEKIQRLLTNVERKSGYGLIDKMEKVSMEHVHEILEKRFEKIPQNKRFTYTYDNGTEIGKEDESLEKKIAMEVYRTYPYHSWERGSNENFNSLIREFFPKGSTFATITQRQVKKVENLLNNRPRKRLGYATPKEAFYGKNEHSH
ncbi:MAG: IS30 family transposase, partial [Actinobacteria bacterium]|nr:IS30 family transposase [Actinomycetota bacterium]